LFCPRGRYPHLVVKKEKLHSFHAITTHWKTAGFFFFTASKLPRVPFYGLPIGPHGRKPLTFFEKRWCSPLAFCTYPFPFSFFTSFCVLPVSAREFFVARFFWHFQPLSPSPPSVFSPHSFFMTFFLGTASDPRKPRNRLNFVPLSPLSASLFLCYGPFLTKRLVSTDALASMGNPWSLSFSPPILSRFLPQILSFSFLIYWLVFVLSDFFLNECFVKTALCPQLFPVSKSGVFPRIFPDYPVFSICNFGLWCDRTGPLFFRETTLFLFG